MKIAHVSMFYLPTFGGVEKAIYELAKRQVNEGHEVHVFCSDSDKNKRIKKKDEIIEGVHVHRFPYWVRLSLNTFIWPSFFWKFNDNFDIVHSHVSGHLYVFLTGILSKIKGFKYIHTTHCPWTDNSFRPFILKPFIFLNKLIFNNLSFRLMNKVIIITPWEKDILKKYVKEKNKIKIIPTGTDEFFYKRVKTNKFKEDNKISEKYLVLFFGRLNPTKGPDKLALAAIDITKERKDIAFIFVGPDEGMAEKVKMLIKPYKNMQYLGPLDNKDKISEMYQAADIYVLPSYREGLPLTLFEAMASRLPIIASPVNGIPYEMKEPENGFFVKYGDVIGLKKMILKLIDDRNLSKKIGNNNYKKSLNYGWDNIFKEYMKEYNNLILY